MGTGDDGEAATGDRPSRTRADSHIHLFRPPWVARDGRSLAGPDETRSFDGLAETHDVGLALVVGYEGAPEFAGNNRQLATVIRTRRWARALAYADPSTTLGQVEAWLEEGFSGISAYLAGGGEAHTAMLARVAPRLVAAGGVLSINSPRGGYRSISELAARNPDLPILISHLGLPAHDARSPSEVLDALAELSELARSPAIHVKASGFWALSGLIDPQHAVEAVLDAFGPQRVVWGSDFPVSLEYSSYRELTRADWIAALAPGERHLVMQENLLRLLRLAPHAVRGPIE